MFPSIVPILSFILVLILSSFFYFSECFLGFSMFVLYCPILATLTSFVLNIPINFFCLDQNDFAENFCSTGTKCPEPCKCSHGESRTKTRVRCDHNKNNKTMNKVKQLLVLIEYFAIETKKSRLNI